MKKIVSLFALACIILLGACHPKKEDPTPPEPPVKDEVRGTLQVSYMKYIGADSLQFPNDTLANASFYDANDHAIAVTSVSLNNKLLNYDNTEKYYASEGTTDLVNNKWDVKGNNGIPDFNYTATASMPSYGGYKTLPNTFSRVKDLVITLTAIKNVEFCSIALYDATGHTVETPVIDMSTTTTLTIPTAELANLDKDAYLAIGVFNEHQETFGGLQFGFDKSVTYYKAITFK